MKSKSMVLMVVAIFAVAAVGATLYLGVLGEDNDAETTKFLIQDDKGIYFWAEGSGDNGKTALVDACVRYGIPSDIADGAYGATINSLFGIASAMVEPVSSENPYGVWAYWSQYSYKDGAWVYNEVSLDKVDTSDVKFIAIVYSHKGDMPAVSPDKAKVWNRSEKGTVFTIRSPSGLEFKINGTGNKVIDSFVAATNNYEVPFTPTGGSSPTGVEDLFGLGMEMTEPISEENPYGVWSWWIQKIPTSDGAGWESTTLQMNNLNTSDTPKMLLVYGTESF